MKTRDLTKGEIRKAAIELLTYRGVECWPQNNLAVPGRKFIGRKGVPDIIGFHKKTGLFIGAEVKANGDRLSIEQSDFLHQLTEAGGIALMAFQDKKGNVVLEKYKLD